MKSEKETLLIVDDDEANCDILSIILKSDEYAIELADNGRVALEKLRGKSYVAVLLDPDDAYDRRLPGFTRVMKNDPDLEDTPVIIITAVGKSESVKHCISLGAKDYILKPFSQDDVRHRVSTVIAENRLRNTERALSQLLLVERQRYNDLANFIIPKGLALISNFDEKTIYESIVVNTISFCNAEAGILYLRTNDNTLKYEVVRNIPQKIQMGGTSGKICPYPALHIMSDSSAGEPNDYSAVTQVIHSGEQINIDIDRMPSTSNSIFTTKLFNEENIYRAISFLITPIKTPSLTTIGVLELINALEKEKGLAVPFNEEQGALVKLYCQLAGIAIQMCQMRTQIAVLATPASTAI